MQYIYVAISFLNEKFKTSFLQRISGGRAACFFPNFTHQTETGTGTAKGERLVKQPTWSNQTI
jgi:hypothetical protein